VPAAQHQPDLFAADTERRQKLSPLIDCINDRYGRCSIGFGLFQSDVSRVSASLARLGSSPDSSLEGDGLELSVPKLEEALLYAILEPRAASLPGSPGRISATDDVRSTVSRARLSSSSS